MPTREPDRVPIFYSAAVYPGVGQLVQRRKAAAVVYAVCFTFFLANVFDTTVAYLKQKRSWAQRSEPPPLEPSR